HLDRQLRARQAHDARARALRRASDRAAPRDYGGRKPAGGTGAGTTAPRGSGGGTDRRDRGRYGDLRLDDAAPLASVGAGACEAGARAPAPLLDPRTERAAARGARGGARTVPRARAAPPPPSPARR